MKHEECTMKDIFNKWIESIGDYDAGDDFDDIISRIKYLKKVKIDNQPDMERCIKNLHELGRIFYMYLDHNEQLAPLFDIFYYHLSMFEKYEGSNYILADISKKVCIRLVPLFIGFINDYYSLINLNENMAKDFEELIIA